MTLAAEPQILFLAAGGVFGGLGLLVRGMGSYRAATRVGDTATSAIRSVAVGEVRLNGAVEAAELTLISPLQSVPCVYYRAGVDESNGRARRNVLREERGVGFKLRDATGEIRIFPNGARWDVPNRFDEGGLEGDPPGLALRNGPPVTSTTVSREEAINELLTVHRPDAVRAGSGGGPRFYREARIEPGDTITLVGMALPFDQLPDPTAADEENGSVAADEGADPEVAADLEEARATGEFVGSADEAWGNAAIPGFGIGHPVRQPKLDPGAHPLPLATEAEAEEARRTFDIAPNTLVVARTRDVPLLIVSGAPSEAAGREQGQFLVGLLGAVLAICSAIALGVLLTQNARL